MPSISEETAQQLIKTVLSMQADVTLIKARQTDANQRLFGNGQPGEITRLQDQVNDLKIWKAEQVGAHRNNKRWSAAISGIISAACASLLEWFVHRSH